MMMMIGMMTMMALMGDGDDDDLDCGDGDDLDCGDDDDCVCSHFGFIASRNVMRGSVEHR